MADFYGPTHRNLQDELNSRPLADAMEASIITDSLDDPARAFIESSEFFFLTTIDHNGRPTVSFKGGAPGFVTVVDERTLAFPSYDGNGMQLSMGNIDATSNIGMLFINFETPMRLRIQATASVQTTTGATDEDSTGGSTEQSLEHAEQALIDRYPGAQLIVRADIDETWPNCPRYIPKYEKLSASKYVPDVNGEAPIPAWKRIDVMQPALSAEAREQVAAEGTIGIEEYGRLLMSGDA